MHPRHIFNILLLFSLFGGYAFKDFILPTLDPSTILRASESSCVVTFPAPGEATTAEVRNLLQSLADVSFKDEPTVIVGQVAPKIDLQSFWPNSQPLIIRNGLKKDILNHSLLVFRRLKKDRNCLLTPSKQMKVPDVVQLDLFLKSMKTSEKSEIVLRTVQEINGQCGTFRNADGSINIKGLHRNEILNNLFQLNEGSNFNHDSAEELSKSCSSYNQNQCSQDSVTNCQSVSSFSAFCQLESSKIEEKYDECEKIPMPSPAHFFHEYLSISKPVIITGAIDAWHAFQKWSSSFLKDKYGQTRVHIKATPDGEYEGVQNKSIWEGHKRFHIPKQVEDQLLYPDLVVERPASLDMPFSEFLELIENVSRGLIANMSAYLEYSSINDYFPELMSDIEEPGFISMLELSSLNVWLSDGNTLGKLHFDPYDNLLCQISGEKHVTLFNPHHNERLYEGHIQEAQFTYNKSTGSFHRSRLLDSTSMVMSPVDLKRPNLGRFPLFAGTRPMKCSIKAGEILFLPSFWWHEVQSKPNISEHRNLAVNFWYKPFLTKEFPCPECKLDVNPMYYHLL